MLLLCSHAADEAEMRDKARFILNDLQPPITSEETIQATREELVANAQVRAVQEMGY
jgi:hypothetical protein